MCGDTCVGCCSRYCPSSLPRDLLVITRRCCHRPSCEFRWLVDDARAHTSAYGIGCVIDTMTGLCVDLSVLSSYCQRCSDAQRRFGKHSPEFEEWFGNNRSECNRNFDGSAGGMEAAAAEQLWERPVERHGFRYTTIVSDGDAKAFQHLCDRRMYGKVELKKEECINHVAKRLELHSTSCVLPARRLVSSWEVVAMAN